MAGTGPNESTSVARMAAPVGVVNSPSIVDSANGMPQSNSAVAGAGTLSSPCAIVIRPMPVGTGEATRRSTPSRSQPTAAPTMSAIESAAPTSWKWTFSIGDAVDFGLGLGQPGEDPPGEVFLARAELPGVDHRQDLVQVAMGVLRLVVDGNLGCPKAVLLDFLGPQPAAGQPERADGPVQGVQRDARIDQGGQGHVAANSAVAIEICHSACSPLHLARAYPVARGCSFRPAVHGEYPSLTALWPGCSRRQYPSDPCGPASATVPPPSNAGLPMVAALPDTTPAARPNVPSWQRLPPA